MTSSRYIPIFETTTFPLPDGTDITFALWRDNDSGREFIQCDKCHKFLMVNDKRYPITLGKHRNSSTCQKAKEIHERKQVVASTTAAANFVAETLFHSKESDTIAIGMTGASLIDLLLHIWQFNVCLFTVLSTGSTSSASPVPTTPTVDTSESTPENLTPRAFFKEFRSNDKMAAHSFLQAIDDSSTPSLLDSAFHRRDPVPNQSSGINFSDPLPGSSPPIYSSDLDSNSSGVESLDYYQCENSSYCTGQLVFWKPGSIWDNYAYEQHADDTLGWKPIGIENAEWIRVQSTECTTYLKTPDEVNRRACIKCQKVTQLASFRKCVDRATGNAPAHMPYKYLTAYQMRHLLVTTRKQNDAMKLKVPLNND